MKKSLSAIAATVLVGGFAVAQSGQIPLPAFTNTYAFTNNTRGFWCPIPADFEVTGIRVPDEAKHGKQNIVVYQLDAQPGSNVTATPVFTSFGTNSATIVATPGLKFTKGKFFAILGSCGDANSTQNNSYGVGNFQSQILGQTVGLQRLWTNTDVVTLKGAGAFTGNTGTASIGRVEVYVKGQPPFATNEIYGKGSTTKPIGRPYIQTNAYNRTYNDSRGFPRGYYFQAPIDFLITGLEHPNESSAAKQTLMLVKMAAEPPAFPATFTTTAASVLHYTLDAATGKPVTFPPIRITKGDWVGVLGVVGDGVATTVTSSYSNTGAGPMNVLGQTTETKRFLMQEIIRDGTKKGVGQGVSGEGTGTGNRGRVRIFVPGQSAFGPFTVPTLDTIGRPAIGTTPKLDLKAMIPTANVGLVYLGAGRLPGLKTPFGNLNVTLPLFVTIPVPGGTAQIPLLIPNDKALYNVKVMWQGAVFDFTNSIFGMTVGNEWLIGG